LTFDVVQVEQVLLTECNPLPISLRDTSLSSRSLYKSLATFYLSTVRAYSALRVFCAL